MTSVLCICDMCIKRVLYMYTNWIPLIIGGVGECSIVLLCVLVLTGLGQCFLRFDVFLFHVFIGKLSLIQYMLLDCCGLCGRGLDVCTLFTLCLRFCLCDFSLLVSPDAE